MTDQRNSRTALALGSSAMEKLSQASVFIIGLSATGSEVMKNFALTNVGTIYYYDEKNVSIYDIGSNFFARDLGKPRSESIVPLIQKLNPKTKLIQHDSISLPPNVSSVVVCEFINISKLKSLGEECHSNSIHFQVAITFGLIGLIFLDFGEEYISRFPDHIEPYRTLVRSVENRDGKMFLSWFEPNTNALFRKGMNIKFLNYPGVEKGKIMNISEHHLEKNWRGGMIDVTNFELIDPIQNFTEIEEIIPTYSFHHKQFPSSSEIEKNTIGAENKKIFETFLSLCERDSLPKLLESEDKILSICSVEYPSLAAFVGSVAAHQSFIFISRTFQPPENQIHIFNHSELMRWTTKPQLQNDRYDVVRAILGEEIFDKINSQTILMVGAGAIGCEYIRNIGFFKPKKIFLFDDDRIELSNLNRQFLFHDEHQDKFKAEVASQELVKFNPDINIEAKCELCRRSNLAKIQVDYVLSAVDKQSARVLLQNFSEISILPFINCGITKTGGNAQIEIPFRSDLCKIPLELGTQPCTLRHSPKVPLHCVYWAHSHFNSFFASEPSFVPKNFEDCISWSISKHKSLIEEKIQVLLNEVSTFLEDDRPGKVIPFSPECPYHYDFAVSCAKIKAKIHQIEIPEKTEEEMKELIQSKISASDFNNDVVNETVSFDKSNNDHISFITALANSWGQCYGIQKISSLYVLQILGNVQPTMSTTSSSSGSCAFLLFPLPFTDLSSDELFTNTTISLTSLRVSRTKPHKLLGKRKPVPWLKDDERIFVWEKIVLPKETTLSEATKLLTEKFHVPPEEKNPPIFFATDEEHFWNSSEVPDLTLGDIVNEESNGSIHRSVSFSFSVLETEIEDQHLPAIIVEE